MTLFPGHQKEETVLRRRLLFFSPLTPLTPYSSLVILPEILRSSIAFLPKSSVRFSIF